MSSNLIRTRPSSLRASLSEGMRKPRTAEPASRKWHSTRHRPAGVAPDLETVPPNRPFLLGALPPTTTLRPSSAPSAGLHAFNSQRRHRRSVVMQRIAGLERALEQRSTCSTRTISHRS